MKDPLVILVDERDNPTGVTGKMEAHKKALLHRAISVFIINQSGEWILQKRAKDKYHSGGLWTNTCCTHPAPGETNSEAADRRLAEEMGISCDLKELFSFIYREKLNNDLTEYEFDHVFFGVTGSEPVINTSEVEEWEAVSFNDMHNDIIANPSDYTYWFREIYRKVQSHISEIKSI